MCVARLAQIIQYNNFAISWQYLKKKVSDEVDFLKADKHESFLQIDTIISMVMVKHSRSSQSSKIAILYNIPSSLQGDLTLWALR